MLPHQLPLNIKLRDEAVFDNFVAQGQTPLLAILKNFSLKQSESFLYCYGSEGVGKTHLLQACCHVAPDIFYLPLSPLEDFSPSIFDSLEYQKMICIDDVDALIGNRTWEEAFFHFYNRARDNNVFLLMSATLPPQQWKSILPDLQSRLSSALILEIKNLNDDEKKHALQLRAKSRGIVLSEDVVTYLINHYSRHMHHLFSVLEKLDHASLVTKRKITIPFIKFVMQDEAFYDKIHPV